MTVAEANRGIKWSTLAKNSDWLRWWRRTNDAPASAPQFQCRCWRMPEQANQAAKEAGNMVDLNNDPTNQNWDCRNCSTFDDAWNFNYSLDCKMMLQKYFAIIPALFTLAIPASQGSEITGLHSPRKCDFIRPYPSAIIIPFFDSVGTSAGVAINPLELLALLGEIYFISILCFGSVYWN